MCGRHSLALSCVIFVACAGTAEAQSVKPFSIPSPHGGAITGQADLPARPSTTAVLMVAGTGMFDRDARFGASGTERDMIFRDMMRRMTARGLATVRYDRRGVDWRQGKLTRDMARVGDPAVLATITDVTQADDYAQVYDWATSRTGLGAKCVIVFAHSEGVVHAAIAAERGAPAPLLFIGMGPPMTDIQSDFRWKATERDAFSIEMMDADHDGITTEAEVRAGWKSTPSAVFGTVQPLLPPPGGWTRALVAEVRTTQAGIFEQGRAQVLAHADTDPYPTAAAVQASYGWWKSWYTDATPIGLRLSRWPSPMSLHYGSLDSQVRPKEHSEAARQYLKPSQLKISFHPGVGHTLGPDVAYGPMTEAIADAIAEEAAEAARGCR